MSDENEVSVEEPVPQAAAPADESKGAEEVQKAEAFAKKSQDDQNRNWKEARRKMQELERKTQEQEQVIQRLSTPKPDDELDKLGRDDIITYGQVDKLIEKRAEIIAQRVMQKREAATVDERLQLKFSDFRQVVTEENIEFLKETEPELAESLGYNPDPYKQGVAVYKLLKKANVVAEDIMAKSSSKEKERAIQNGQKPMSVNAVTKQSAIGNAHIFENGLTPELKASLRKEMREAARYA